MKKRILFPLLMCLLLCFSFSASAEETYGGYIKIETKLDGKALKDVALNVYSLNSITDANGNTVYEPYQMVATGTTDENGLLITEKIPTGTYIVVEESSPQNVTADKEEHFLTVKNDRISYFTLTYKDSSKKDGKVESESITKDVDDTYAKNCVVMKAPATPSYLKSSAESSAISLTTGGTSAESNVETCSINVSAIDTKSTNQLANVALALLDDGKVVAEWNTNGSIKTIEGLEVGKSYTIRVKSTPEGYIKPENISFVAAQDMNAIMVNVNPTIVTFSVQDKTDNAYISGARIGIYTSDGTTEIKAVESASSPLTIQALPVGTYMIKQISATKGYAVANAQTFTVTETADPQACTMQNSRVVGSIEVTVVTSVNKKPVKNAEFTFYDKDGKKLETITTDNDGKAVTKEYEIGSYANGAFGQTYTYKIKQTSAPKGYKADSKTYNVKFDYINDTTASVYQTLKVPNVVEAGENKSATTAAKNLISGNASTGDLVAMLPLIIGVVLCVGGLVLLKVKSGKDKKKDNKEDEHRN